MSSPTEREHDLIGNCWCGGIVHQTGASIVTSTVCEVCGEPNASGYNRCPNCPRRGKQGPTFADTPCGKCGHWIGWIDCPTGGWWAHHEHPEDGHDAVPVVVKRLRDDRL